MLYVLKDFTFFMFLWLYEEYDNAVESRKIMPA